MDPSLQSTTKILLFLSLQLLVKATIIIRDGPIDSVVVQGQPFSFHCLAEDPGKRGSILVQWKHNGIAIQVSSTPRLNLFPNGTLYFMSTQSGDEGSYSCLVSVITGQGIVEQQESITAQLYFAYIEDFFYPPSPLMVIDKQEEPAYFQCISGDSRPLATIHWEKDGELYVGNTYQTTFGGRDSLMTSGTLQIDNVTRGLEGRYRCIATNSLLPGQPRYSSYATMTVQANPGEPYFSIAPSSKIIPLGEPATFHCLILGDPEPAITWQKQGESGNIAQDDSSIVLENGTLYFKSVRESDEGGYSCKGRSRLGVVNSHTVMLTTAYMNWTFIAEPINTEVIEETSATLLCRPPLSKPPAEITWYKDNQVYSPRDGVAVLGVGDLYIASVRREDAGSYFCVATNQYIPRSVTSQTASLEVRVGATITIPPQNTAVVLGNDLTLTCAATGDPEPTIIWYRDNKELSAGGRITFGNSNGLIHIINVISLDQGTYSCQASNNYGLEFVSAFVDILVPPHIVVPPGDLNAGLGTPIFIPCEVIGDPFPSVTWTKNGSDLSTVPDSSRYQLNSQGLYIESIELEDGGRYECSAGSSIGADSAVGTLTVETIPEIITFPDNKTVSQGAVVFFQCKAIGTPTPSIMWKYNDGSLPISASISSQGQVLTVSSVSRTSDGRYTCMAENTQGTTEVDIYLRVTAGPLVEPIMNVTTSIGMLQVIECNAEGYPDPTFSWLKEQDVIMSGEGIIFPQPNQLQLSIQSKTNQGWYSCVASNDFGSDRKSFYLTVRDLPGKPIIDDAAAQSESSILVTWHAGTDPSDTDSYQLQYKISFDSWSIAADSITSSQETESFILTGLTENREYHIRLLAQNDLGVSLPSEVFIVYTPSISGPSAPRNLDIISFNATSVQLEWEIPEERDGPIHAYRVEYSKAGREDEFIIEVPGDAYTISTTVSSLRPNSNYSFRICAATLHNDEKQWGNCTEPLHQTTSKSAPDQAPTDIEVVSLSSTAVVLTWGPVADNNQNAAITGYNVMYKKTSQDGDYQITSINGSIFSSIIMGLRPYTAYDVKIQAVNDYGAGPSTDAVQVQTQAATPLDSPHGVHLFGLNQTTIRITWEAVPVASQRGPIDGYMVYVHIASAELFAVYDVASPNMTLDISGLKVGSMYKVQLSAYNRVDNKTLHGPKTPLLKVSTADGIPGSVNSVSVGTSGSSYIYLHWQPPAESNGVLLGYLIQYAAISKISMPYVPETDNMLEISDGLSRNRRDTMNVMNATHGTIHTNMTFHNLTSLAPATNFSVAIAAMTSAGPGDIMEIFASTDVAPTFVDPTKDVGAVKPPAEPQGGMQIFGLPLNSFIIFVSAMTLAVFALLLAVITITAWCSRSLNGSHKVRIRHAPPLLRNDQFVHQRHVSSEELGVDNYSRTESRGSSSPNSSEAAPTSSHVLEQPREGLLDHRQHTSSSPPPSHYNDQTQTLPRIQHVETEMNPYGTAPRLDRQRSRDAGTSPEQLDELYTRVNNRSSRGPSRMKKDSLAAIAVLLDSEENDYCYQPPGSPPSVVISDQRTVL